MARQADPARDIKDALVGYLTTAYPSAVATLQVDDDYRPSAATPLLLVADDGGRRINAGAWSVRKTPLRITIRLTAFAAGRTQARNLVDDSAAWLVGNKPSGIRIDDVSAVLEAKDTKTGAVLASITMPVIVKSL